MIVRGLLPLVAINQSVWQEKEGYQKHIFRVPVRMHFPFSSLSPDPKILTAGRSVRCRETLLLRETDFDKSLTKSHADE